VPKYSSQLSETIEIKAVAGMFDPDRDKIQMTGEKEDTEMKHKT